MSLISAQVGGRPVDFMSPHPQQFPQKGEDKYFHSMKKPRQDTADSIK